MNGVDWTHLAHDIEQCRAVTKIHISTKEYTFKTTCVSNKTYYRTSFQEFEVNSASGAPTLPVLTRCNVKQFIGTVLGSAVGIMVISVARSSRFWEAIGNGTPSKVSYQKSSGFTDATRHGTPVVNQCYPNPNISVTTSTLLHCVLAHRPKF